MHKLSIGIFALLSIVSCEKAQSRDVNSDGKLIVKLASPKANIRGHVLKSANGEDFYAFQDIPYAEPPVGKLRFKAPVRSQGWSEVLDATENRVVCPQNIDTKLPQDEDCLKLNVYSPVKPGSKARKAVYVWIHGGAYTSWDGTINRYNPKFLIDYDIVVVTLNYRLASFGFLATEDGVIPGNLALRDQSLALEWVQENIHLFGGDPRQVTIGGESAGSSSVSSHLLSLQSRGLFRAAIQQSGSAMSTYSYQNRPDFYAFQLGKALDSSLEYGNSTRLLEVLQKATVAEILDAQGKVVTVSPSISVIPDLVWAPVIETAVKEEPAFLWRPYHEVFANGTKDDWNIVPQLLITDINEILWFTPGAHSKSLLQFDWNTIDANIARLDEDPSRLINEKYNIPDERKKQVGAKLKSLYTKSTFLEDKEAYLTFATDIYFSLPTIHQAVLSSQHVPVYLGIFSYSPFGNDSITKGADHTEELQYLWGNIEDFGFVNEFQLKLQRQMLEMWTNFIKYLNPTPGFKGVKWPTVNPKTLLYLNINATLSVSTNPKMYRQSRDILSEFKQPPMIVY